MASDQEAQDLYKRIHSSSSLSVVTIIPTAAELTSSLDSSVKTPANPCTTVITGIKPADASGSNLAFQPGVIHTPNPRPAPGVLTPVIVEILKHQRDSRYNPVPRVYSNPPPPTSTQPTEPRDKQQTLTFAKCNQCEAEEGAYTECYHPEDEGPFDTTVYLDRIINGIGRDLKSISEEPPNSINEIEYEMLSSRNLTGLLSANADEHASYFVVFTARGTLLGYSDAIEIRHARKVSALAGITWRANEIAINNGLEGSIAPTSTLLKTLQINTNDKTGKLSSMVVQSENFMTAICDVGKHVLVAAIVGLETPVEKKTRHTKERAEQKFGKQTSSATSPATTPSAATEEVSTSSEPIDKTSSDKVTAENGISAEPSSGAIPTGKQQTDEGKKSPISSPKLGPSQEQILLWKAEGIAEALHIDLGRGFSLPENAY